MEEHPRPDGERGHPHHPEPHRGRERDRAVARLRREGNPPIVRILLAAVAALAVATIISMILLWPGIRPLGEAPTDGVETVGATVTKVEQVECQLPDADGCVRATARIEEGADEGEDASFIAGQSSSEVTVSVGDEVRLVGSAIPDEASGLELPDGQQPEAWAFSDFERRAPMLYLAIAFATIVLVFGRWRGLRALFGLGASLLVVVMFIVPGLLADKPAVLVAITGAFAVMFLTIPVAHGLGLKTIAATLGTAVSLLLTLGLALMFAELAHLTGFSSDEAAYLRASVDQISIQGLLLAGVVIGALGVLDDVTVTQASTVLALRKANPAMGFGELFSSALSVGRDHITATVNTLVLAYVGASLPTLLVFAVADFSVTDALNGEVVAEQVIATLVGSIGLIAAVPVTTALAAMLATHLAPELISEHEAHGHAH